MQKETFLDRLLKEKAQLDSKIEKLTAFVKTEKAATLDNLQLSLLRIQLPAMLTYSNCLDIRIEYLSAKTVSNSVIQFTDLSKLRQLPTKELTFGDLFEACKPLTNEQLNNPVLVLREDETVHKISFEVLNENYIVDVENTEQGCFPESDADPDMETRVAYKKGTPILWENF